MSEKITDLDLLRIHELRDLARKMGVNAPTSKKKETLIDEIKKIMNGEAVPFSDKSNKGRPVRNSGSSFDVVDLILPTQEEFSSFDDSYEYEINQEKMRFMVNMEYAEYNSDENESDEHVEGLIEIKPEGYGVLHVQGLYNSNTDVFVNKTIVKQLMLKTGEKISAKSRKIKDNYPNIAYDIKKKSINNGVNYDKLELKPLSADISISTHDLQSFRLGGRYFVKPTNDAYEATADIAVAIKNQLPDAVVETLFLNAMLERIPYGKDIVINNIPFSKMDEDVVCGVNLYFERLKRLVETTCKNVIVVINELTQFVKSYNNLVLKNSSYSEIANSTAHSIKKLLSCAKNTEVGSITIIAVDKLRVPLNIENLFKYEILPLFNN